MPQSLLDRLVELMERDYPEDWARLRHLAHTREQGLTEAIAIIAKHRIEQLAPQDLLGLARPAQDHEIVGVAHDTRAEASLQHEHLPSQHDLDPAPSKSPEEAARRCLRSYARRGPLDTSLSLEIASLCGKFIEHFVDAFRDRMVGRRKGTLERKPLEPDLVRAWALRFDPDELVCDGGELIIVDVRVDPAPVVDAPVGVASVEESPAAARNSGGAAPVADWGMVDQEVFRLMDENGEFIDGDPEWNAQARLEKAISDYCETTFHIRPGENTVRTHVRKALKLWRQRRTKT